MGKTRCVYVMHFWLYYILFIVITVMCSYILTTEITAPVSASAQSDAGAGIILAHIGCQYHLNNCEI